MIAQAAEPPGHDVLLCAPTGSGKTLAAFLWTINQLVLEAQAGALKDEVSVLYVSPLKALANDIRLNLEEPLAGVRDAARAAGLEWEPIRAGLRTGDTPVAERGAMLQAATADSRHDTRVAVYPADVAAFSHEARGRALCDRR